VTVTVPFKHLPPPQMEDPSADAWTEVFWDAARREELVAAKCAACGTYRMPPGRFCRSCNSQEVVWEQLPGTGSLYSWTVVRQPLNPAASEHVPYVPAVVEADGAPGMRFVSNLVDCEPDDITPGMTVRVVWHKVNDELTIPLWAPA
jgi:uncharacterized OB-fold protein